MAHYYPQQQPAQQFGQAQNLQFYPSSYSSQPVSGHSTPFQAYNAGSSGSAYPASSYGPSFGGQPGVSGRMGEQGGLRTGWLAAFGTEGYDGEPPLLEELGVNFHHIKLKVGSYRRWGIKFASRTDAVLVPDSHRAQSSRANRPTYHGRFRLGWAHSVLPALWHLFALRTSSKQHV